MASTIPQNQARFELSQLAEVTGGRWLQCGVGTHCVGVATDTRETLRGKAFIALRGKSFDGHHYLAAAAQSGACVLIVEPGVSAEALPAGVSVLEVQSTLTALGALAADHRRRWPGRVVAVAGSVGKTTTRATTAALLSAAGFRVHSPAGNLNNFIGVPMVLLGLGAEADCCVVELGTNQTGEVPQLTAIASPDAALLTRIALEHCEGLGDLDAIEREEGALFHGLRMGAVAATNADDPRCLRQLCSVASVSAVTYGLIDREVMTGKPAQWLAHYQLSALEESGAGAEAGFGVRFEVQRQGGHFDGTRLRIESPLLGAAGAYAVVGAIALTETLCGRALTAREVDEAQAQWLRPEAGRLSPLVLGRGVVVLDDTYNASPASVISSARVARAIAERRGGRLILAIGEMRELGALADSAHTDVGKELRALAIAHLVGFGGPQAARLVEAFASHHALEAEQWAIEVADAASALAALRERLQERDVVLVKASRSLRAEQIVQGLRSTLGEAA